MHAPLKIAPRPSIRPPDHVYRSVGQATDGNRAWTNTQSEKADGRGVWSRPVVGCDRAVLAAMLSGPDTAFAGIAPALDLTVPARV